MSFEDRHGPQGYRPAMSKRSLRRNGLTELWEPDRVAPPETETTKQGEQMTDFTYTHYSDRSSSAVEEAAYNSHTKEALFVLTGGSGYIYKDVPQSVWNEYVTNWSAGHYYAKGIKPNYGPGEYVGYVSSLRDSFDEYTEPDRGAVGTPKDLTYAGSTTTNTAVTNTGGGTYTLTLPGPATEAYETEVVFTVGDDATEKTYRTRAGSVVEAVNALTEVGKALQLDLKAKRVTVTL